MHYHHTKATIESTLATVPANVKQTALLSGDWKGNYAVATIVIDNIQPPAEVHMEAADVWIVTAGSPIFTIGGTLVSPIEKKPGELVADLISGGEVVRATVGDVVDIPRGVPHQVDARGQRAEFLILKIRSA